MSKYNNANRTYTKTPTLEEKKEEVLEIKVDEPIQEEAEAPKKKGVVIALTKDGCLIEVENEGCIRLYNVTANVGETIEF